MGRILVDNAKPRVGHVRSEDQFVPSIEPLKFLDVKEKDLPYGGKLSARKNAKPCEGVNFALLEQTVIQKGEGKLLMAALTGVHAAKKSLFNTRLPSSGPTLNHKAATVQFASEVAPTMGLKCSPRGDTINESKKLVLVDAAMDTHDLIRPIDVPATVQEPEQSWLFETPAEEDIYNRINNPGLNAAPATSLISIKDYVRMVKNSMEKIDMRTAMLEELELAEDVEKLPNTYMDPVDELRHKPRPTSENAGAMCATSLVIKQARRLVGMLDHDQRVVDLTEVGLWLQKLGDIAAVKDEKGVERKSQAPFLQKYIPRPYNVGDWRLPSSPAIALMFAQDDIRERLNLQSKSKQIMLHHQAELEAAKKKMESISGQEEDMQGYLEGLNTAATQEEVFEDKIGSGNSDMKSKAGSPNSASMDTKGRQDEGDGDGYDDSDIGDGYSSTAGARGGGGYLLGYNESNSVKKEIGRGMRGGGDHIKKVITVEAGGSGGARQGYGQTTRQGDVDRVVGGASGEVIARGYEDGGGGGYRRATGYGDGDRVGGYGIGNSGGGGGYGGATGQQDGDTRVYGIGSSGGGAYGTTAGQQNGKRGVYGVRSSVEGGGGHGAAAGQLDGDGGGCGDHGGYRAINASETVKKFKAKPGTRSCTDNNASGYTSSSGHSASEFSSGDADNLSSSGQSSISSDILPSSGDEDPRQRHMSPSKSSRNNRKSNSLSGRSILLLATDISEQELSHGDQYTRRSLATQTDIVLVSFFVVVKSNGYYHIYMVEM
ncbi:unnamed protein product, partial [Sphagnum compactum]